MCAKIKYKINWMVSGKHDQNKVSTLGYAEVTLQRQFYGLKNNLLNIHSEDGYK